MSEMSLVGVTNWTNYIMCHSEVFILSQLYQQQYTKMYESEVKLDNICCTAVYMR